MLDSKSTDHELVLHMLEVFTEEVKANPRIGYGHMLFVEDGPNPPTGGYCGNVIHEVSAQRAMVNAAAQMQDRIINRVLPARDNNVPADYAIYNMPSGSISYDFIIWLIDREMTRMAENAAPPLKVFFWFGRDGKAGLYTDAQKQMFEHVCKPSLELVGAIEHPDAIHGRDSRAHMTAITNGAREGKRVPTLKAPVRAREAMDKYLGRGGDDRVPITITLREADHWPHRNSNWDAWSKFARELIQAGERVIFVRDTAKANELPIGFAACPPASTDLHTRVALYERAKANLFVANGPCILAAFMDKPWLTFTPIEPDNSLYKANTAQFWRMYVGVDVGGQYPWSRPDQRIVWNVDSYENIVAAWRDLERCVVSKVAAE